MSPTWLIVIYHRRQRIMNRFSFPIVATFRKRKIYVYFFTDVWQRQRPIWIYDTLGRSFLSHHLSLQTFRCLDPYSSKSYKRGWHHRIVYVIIKEMLPVKTHLNYVILRRDIDICQMTMSECFVRHSIFTI